MKWVFILIGTGVLVAGGIWYLKKDRSAPEYKTAAVARGDLIEVVTATGQLSPVVNVQVGSQISGRIKAIHADFNANVTSNQVIAEIDPSTYQVAILRAEAQLSNSVANLALAQVQARRAQSLFTNKLIPAADHDTAMAELQQAEAQVRSDEANLASARVDLSRCMIYAPVDGVVITRNVDVGQTVAASFNTPTLFVIANDLSQMQIGALVSEADIGGVEVGQDVTFTVDAFPERTFRGQVSQIRYGAVTNQNVVNYSAIIDVDNEDLKLLPSMTANVSIITKRRDNVLRVPNSALRFRPPAPEETAAAGAPPSSAAPGAQASERRGGGGEGRGGAQRGEGRRDPSRARGQGRGSGDAVVERTVHILKAGNPKAPELVPVKIRTGITDGINTEVISGLNEGDQVVTSMVVESDTQPSPAPGGGNPFGGGRFRRF